MCKGRKPMSEASSGVEPDLSGPCRVGPTLTPIGEPTLRPCLALSLTFALLLIAPPAAEAMIGTRVQHLSGSCETLLVSGRSATRGCRPTLVNLVYPSGAMSFVLTDRSGRLISFFGRVAQRSGSQTTIKIGQITMVPRGATQAVRLSAAGSCVLTPFAADQARLECSARAGGGTYSALFKTSGLGSRPLTLGSVRHAARQ